LYVAVQRYVGEGRPIPADFDPYLVLSEAQQLMLAHSDDNAAAVKKALFAKEKKANTVRFR